MTDDVDSILDEIDEVLESNAEEFVRAICTKRAASEQYCTVHTHDGSTKYCQDCGDYRPVSASSRGTPELGTASRSTAERMLAERAHAAGEARRTRPRAQADGCRDGSWFPMGHKWCPDCDSVLAHWRSFARTAGRQPVGYSAVLQAVPQREIARITGTARRLAQLPPTRRYGITARRSRCDARARRTACAPSAGERRPQHVDHDHATGRSPRVCSASTATAASVSSRTIPTCSTRPPTTCRSTRSGSRSQPNSEACTARPGGASRPGEPPVGSQRRPGGRAAQARGVDGTNQQVTPSSKQPGEAEH